MTCIPELTVSRSSDVEWLIRDVRRAATGTAYATGTVTATVRVYDPTGTTALTAALSATFDTEAGAFVALIPPTGTGYGSVLVRETIVAGGRTLVTEFVVTVVA